MTVPTLNTVSTETIRTLNQRQSLQLVLESAFSGEQLTGIITLYDESSAAGESLTLNAFCEQIQTLMPGVNLSREVRLMLLKVFRRPVTMPDENIEPESATPYAQPLEPSHGQAYPSLPVDLDDRPYPGLPESLSTSTMQADDTCQPLVTEPFVTEVTPLPSSASAQPANPAQTDSDIATKYLSQYVTKLDREPRRPTHLEGAYILADKANGASGVTDSFIVTNLSRSGACLHLFSPNPCLTTGTAINIRFILDTATRDIIGTLAQVRWVQNEAVGVQFLSVDGFSQALIDYLRT